MKNSLCWVDDKSNGPMAQSSQFPYRGLWNPFDDEKERHDPGCVEDHLLLANADRNHRWPQSDLLILR